MKITEDLSSLGVAMPKFDIVKMRQETLTNPQWIHFGGGNLYRCVHAKIAQDLLNQGLTRTGIIVGETFDSGLVGKFYEKYDCKSLTVEMLADGSIKQELIASTAQALLLNNQDSCESFVKYFQNPSLQFITITITEKGYTLNPNDNNTTNNVLASQSFIGKLVSLMFKRFEAGKLPIALVSTDNFSHNGDRLKANVLEQAKAYNNADFTKYLTENVAYPFSMIDRITPLADKKIAEQLQKLGIDAEIDGNIANFVNTEETNYLVIEDVFPNGRIALDKGGVYLGDRDTVNNADLMKVTTCLNPLHTSLAIFGCLLGYDRIYKEMQNDDLRQLVEHIGYKEGLPVVVNPKIIEPKQFLTEVLEKRLVNPNIPDMPQRIATDTSQKLPIRFGETINTYMKQGKNLSDLKFISLTLAAYLRYLLAIDDKGEKFEPSPDPRLNELQAKLQVSFKQKADLEDVRSILSDESLFGANLIKNGMANRVLDYFNKLNEDVGAVAKTLHSELN